MKALFNLGCLLPALAPIMRVSIYWERGYGAGRNVKVYGYTHGATG